MKKLLILFYVLMAMVIIPAIGWPVGGLGVVNAHAASITFLCDPNIESDLAGYVLHYGNESGVYGNSVPFPIAAIVNPNTPEFPILDLTPGTYYFALTAYDTEGLKSGYSNEVMSNLHPNDPEGFKVKFEFDVTVTINGN